MDEKQRSTRTKAQTTPDESFDTLLSLLSEARDPAEYQLILLQWFSGQPSQGREGRHRDCPGCH